jgi:cell division protein FtsB
VAIRRKTKANTTVSDEAVSEASARMTAGQLKVLTLAIIVVLVAGAGFFAWQYKQANDEAKKAQNEVARLSNPQEAAKEEVKQLTDKVANLVAVPNETPTLATVNDPSKLKDQTFFARAEKGDKVLIFTQAKRAILYRPSTNKVIESAPVNIGSSSAQSGAASPNTATPAQ